MPRNYGSKEGPRYYGGSAGRYGEYDRNYIGGGSYGTGHETPSTTLTIMPVAPDEVSLA